MLKRKSVGYTYFPTDCVHPLPRGHTFWSLNLQIRCYADHTKLYRSTKATSSFSSFPFPLTTFMKSDAGFKCLRPDSRTSSPVLNLSCFNQTSSLLTPTDLQLLPPLRSESGCHPWYHHFKPISAMYLGQRISTYATLIVSIASFHPLYCHDCPSIDHLEHYSHYFSFSHSPCSSPSVRTWLLTTSLYSQFLRHWPHCPSLTTKPVSSSPSTPFRY